MPSIETKHTPTPWQYTFTSGHNNLAMLHTESITPYKQIASGLTGDDAALIVQAVNQHALLLARNAELAEALASCLLRLGHLGSEENGRCAVTERARDFLTRNSSEART